MQQKQHYLLPPAFPEMAGEFFKYVLLFECTRADLSRRQVFLKPQVHETVALLVPTRKKPALIPDLGQKILHAPTGPFDRFERRCNMGGEFLGRGPGAALLLVEPQGRGLEHPAPLLGRDTG